tara:strand:- start:358 stop:996 length:639 start_codon:yes stop_codon:yes gene_type:complete
MGYIGKVPTPQPLTASDIPDLAASKITSGTLAVARGGTGLASGTSGQFLKFTGTTTLASAVAGGGKVLQVTQNRITGERNTNSTTHVATNIYHNITPSATSSKVLVIVSLPSIYSSNRSRPTAIKLYRHNALVSVGGSEAGTEINQDNHMNYQGGNDKQGTKTVYTELDSPSSTSAVYYQIYFRSHNSDNTSYIGQNGTPVANVTLLEIDGS